MLFESSSDLQRIFGLTLERSRQEGRPIAVMLYARSPGSTQFPRVKGPSNLGVRWTSGIVLCIEYRDDRGRNHEETQLPSQMVPVQVPVYSSIFSGLAKLI